MDDETELSDYQYPSDDTGYEATEDVPNHASIPARILVGFVRLAIAVAVGYGLGYVLGIIIDRFNSAT